MLQLDGLVRDFGERRALDGVSFTVEPGRTVGFVGPNGAGKSTTMRIALGTLRPDAGEVRWAGRPADAQARARFGAMPEERGLYPRMRVGEQLVFMARLHGLGRVQAAEVTDRWLERLGIADRARERVESLSLGNQQRVQLGAALVHDPELLILDEPFSGLDPLAVDVMAEVLRERCAQGVAVLFSSHQLELMDRLCDDVVILSSGRVVAAGPVGELRATAQGARRVEVRVVDPHGAPVAVADSRLPELAAVAEVRPDGSAVLTLPERTDLDELLDVARKTGTVTTFRLLVPSLSDLFRSAMRTTT